VTNASFLGRIGADMAAYQADVLAAADLTTAACHPASVGEVIWMRCAAQVDALTGARKTEIIRGLSGLSPWRLPMEVEMPTASVGSRT
jgi:hypothetical protein